jgi:hypothetical protein
MDSFKRYIKKYGIPMSVYLDKHTTYKSPAQPMEDELPLSEFGRASKELGVEIIPGGKAGQRERVLRKPVGTRKRFHLYHIPTARRWGEHHEKE